MLFIAVLGLLTGIYTMVGGLLAVVWTESVQTVLLLIGAVVTHFTVAGSPDWRSIWLVPTLGLAAVWAAFVIGFRPRPPAEPAAR